MLKEIEILFCLFILGTWSYGQDSSSVFIEYSLSIQRGESHILEDKFKEAMNHYNDAIKMCKPLASDCFTAMQLAAVNENTKKFKQFTIKGVQTGLKREDFKNDSLLHDYFNDNKLNKFLEKTYKVNRLKYEKGLNKYLLDTLNKLSQIDNHYKIMYIDSLSRVDTVNRNVYEMKYDSIVTNLVENSLIPIIEKYGYPGQRLTGANKVGQIKDSYNYSFSNNKALFILLHYYSNPKPCKYNSLFENEVFKGNMRPEIFASIMDFQYQYGLEANCKSQPYNQWWKSDDSSQFEIINRRRKVMGLGPFQEEEKKHKRGLNICYKYDINEFKHVRLFYWCG